MDIEYNYLDDEWINNFEKTDKLYEDFYKDDLYYINLRILYINRNNEIDKIKHESFLLTTKNYISREEILGILKNNSTDNETNYSLLSILKYNINLEPDEVKNYLKNYNENDKYCNYLSAIKNIDAILFEKSITMFHDLNDLIFIFHEKSKELVNQNKNNISRKHLNSSKPSKKTIKNRYKD